MANTLKIPGVGGATREDAKYCTRYLYFVIVIRVFSLVFVESGICYVGI